MIGIDIQGAGSIQKLLKRIETKEVTKIARQSTRETQKNTVLKDAKSNALTIVGGEMGAKLSKSLAVRAMTKMQRGSYGAKTMIKSKDYFVHVTDDGVRHYIPNAIEYGHGYPGRAGNKDVKPMPFMRKAYEKNRLSAVTKLAALINVKLQSAVRRGKK